MSLRFLLKGLLFITVLVVVGYLLNDTLNKHWVDTFVRHSFLPPELVFLLSVVLLTAAGVSRQLMAFLGGYAFGFGEGVLISTLATVGGCMLTYGVAHFLARDFIQHHLTSRMSRVHDFLVEHTFSTALMIRLLPVGSNVLVNSVAGASGIAPLAFFSGSALGYIPQMLIFALIGSGVTVDPALRISIGVVLFVISALLGFYLYRRFRLRESLGEIPG